MLRRRVMVAVRWVSGVGGAGLLKKWVGLRGWNEAWRSSSRGRGGTGARTGRGLAARGKLAMGGASTWHLLV